MKVTCTGCQTIYRIADEKVPEGGGRAICPNCGQEILIVPGGRGRASPGFPGASPGADFGQTMAYDYSEVDQSRTEVSAFLERISSREPYLDEGSPMAVRDVQTGQEYPLSGAQCTLGRSGCDINLNDPEVSRRHCLLKVFGAEIVVVDLESTNGTFVGGRKIMTANLDIGHRFTVGNTTLEVVISGGD
ncbi:MAG: zinc-ribbon domain-containing protein [bacterium]|nr:MAG: zinc-ribbon domain-containing protein [bacterium]